MNVLLDNLERDFVAMAGPVFLGWIAFSIVLGIVYYKIKHPGSTLKAALQFVAPARVYFSKSFRHDVLIYFKNIYLLAGFAWLSGTTLFSTPKDITENFLIQHFGFSPAPLTSNLTVNILYSITNIIAFDIGWFLSHWAYHRVPVLWAFHKVHHSATELTPLTRSRFHIFEDIPMYSMLGASVGLNTYIFKALGYHPSIVTITNGFPIFMIVFSMFAILRHTNIPISWGRLDWIFSSPVMHQLHHSSKPEHIDKNYAMNLSILDWLIGTQVLPEKNAAPLKYGLSEEHDEDLNIVQLYFIQPFQDVWGYLKRGEIFQHAANKKPTKAAVPVHCPAPTKEPLAKTS